ncbi:MAG: sigma-E factor negative regulatory protein [Woeseiaceae bacterium]
MNDAIRMQISAFVDGELPDNEADLLLRRMGQDAELRQKVAEFLAIGRAMRGETSVPGVDRVHERVSAVLDDKPFENLEDARTETRRPAIRPLAGIAIAASVALLAIFGLQQMTPDSGDAVNDPVVADVDPAATYTVPQPANDQLREYYRSHGAITNENGANGINMRLVTLRLEEEVLDDSSDSAGDTDEQVEEPVETQ